MLPLLRICPISIYIIIHLSRRHTLKTKSVNHHVDEKDNKESLNGKNYRILQYFECARKKATEELDVALIIAVLFFVYFVVVVVLSFFVFGHRVFTLTELSRAHRLILYPIAITILISYCMVAFGFA